MATPFSTHTLDLHFLGQPGVIAAAAIPCADGVVVIDPGPSSCLDALEAGLAGVGYRFADIRALLLTHIHFDHAGATGTLVRTLPGLPVFVHESGARHLASPERLLASATRLYGDDMQRLWGEFLAVPAAAMRTLVGGETIEAGDRSFDVLYTPGHASHHVSFRDHADGTAYVGDAAGIAVGPGYVVPATPPPDIDLERWATTLDALEAWQPTRLFVTHFGAIHHPAQHLALYRSTLARASEAARRVLTDTEDDSACQAAWVRWLRADIGAGLTDAQVQTVALAAPFEQLWQGLARYWRKRIEREGLQP